METVCIKLDESLSKHLGKALKEHHYSTKTDFVREAIRDKLRVLEKERALRWLEDNFGKWKPKPGVDYEKVRQEVGEEFTRRLLK
ncbi:MAG: ribbon-helix-helix domain-containing protein [Nanoarchaeota archaeon]